MDQKDQKDHEDQEDHEVSYPDRPPVRVPVASVDTTVLVIELYSAGDGLGQGEAWRGGWRRCRRWAWPTGPTGPGQPDHSPEVLVCTPDSFCHSGPVTYLATRLWADLISGMGSDILV